MTIKALGNLQILMGADELTRGLTIGTIYGILCCLRQMRVLCELFRAIR
jgi:hypothetical protein